MISCIALDVLLDYSSVAREHNKNSTLDKATMKIVPCD